MSFNHKRTSKGWYTDWRIKRSGESWELTALALWATIGYGKCHRNKTISDLYGKSYRVRDQGETSQQSFPRWEAFEQSKCLGKPQVMQAYWSSQEGVCAWVEKWFSIERDICRDTESGLLLLAFLIMFLFIMSMLLKNFTNWFYTFN